MTKTKSQLRAEAVERLNHSWNACIRDTRQLFGSLVGGGAPTYAERNDYDALIDLLTDDELPEGDAVGILRKAAKCTSVNTSVGDVLRYNVPGNGGSAWQTEEDACEALADMVERDYVRREEYVALGKSLGIAQAEREEWKAKAEGYAEALEKLGCSALANGTVYEGSSKVRAGSSSAKRAEAVERLMAQLDKGNTSAHLLETVMGDVKGNGANWNAEIHALIDLLTDEGDCGHSADMSAKSTDCVREGGEMSDVDSREKLEEDAVFLINDLRQRGWDLGPVDEFSRENDGFRNLVNLLDRQAAITKQECADTRVNFIERMRLGDKIDELQSKVDRLTRENVSLARDLGECMAERDSWRYRWHQVRVLMDEPLQCDRATLVDIDGEVVG